MKNSQLDKTGNMIFVYLFVFLLILPFLRAIDKEDELVSRRENRTLNTLPSWPTSIEEVIRYPEGVTNYYADHFGYRKKLTSKYVAFNNWISDNDSEHPFVTQGKGDWLFLGSLRGDQITAGDPMGDAMNINLYLDDQLKQTGDALSYVDKYLKDKGIHFMFFVAPNKHTIYFENLPGYIKKVGEFSALDQLLNYLRSNTDIHAVDLRPTLMENKKYGKLYHKQDTHWNYLGANYAQYELMTEMQKFVPNDIHPILVPYQKFEKIKINHGDLLVFSQLPGVEEIDYRTVLSGQCVVKHWRDWKDKKTKRMVETCDTKNGKALVFRDSFFEMLRPYFSRQFNETTYLWTHLTMELLVQEVEKQRPDVVVYETVERHLPFVPFINLDIE